MILSSFKGETNGFTSSKGMKKQLCLGALLVMSICQSRAQSPTIHTQPQSVAAIAGANVVLTVGASGGNVSALPYVSSGTLRLWLKSDAGVTTAGNRVTQWQDQSIHQNHASQADTNLQPLFVNSAVPVSGKPVIRFDGVQSPSTGDFLQGTGDVAVGAGYTSFLVYSRADRVASEQVAVLIGIPRTSVRSHYIRDNEMAFSGWGNDYGTGFSIPPNSFRIWTDRMNGTKTLLEFFDTDGTSAFTSASASSGFGTPEHGYFLGGLGSETRNFRGDIAEVIFYQGALNDTDRITVENYLKQKYYEVPSPAGNLVYQWQFNGTNLPGATTDSLSILNLQPENAGIYSVTVTNDLGATTSSNAVVTISVPPSITTPPQNQSVAAGGGADFTVVANGTSPFAYQWYFNGMPIPGATSSGYSITNAQSSHAGLYSVTVSNSVGSVQSAFASLEIIAPPAIISQPQNQSVIVGTNVTFSVGLDTEIPPVTSGTLRLWLKADAGVITNSAGLVSQWLDQSASGNHAIQQNTNKQPRYIGAAVPTSGRPTVRFDGIQDINSGDWMRGANDVNIPAGYTSFLVYLRADRIVSEQVLVGVGVPGQGGALRSHYIRNSSEMALSGWGNDYGTGFSIPANSYRIWTDRLNNTRSVLEFFDITSATTNAFSTATSGLGTPNAGYYVGGLGSSTRNFQGDISELIVYQGALSDAERSLIENYLKMKYFSTAGGDGLGYQWMFNGTNIAGATNFSLTLSNVQPADAGNYSVVVANSAGSTTSTDAILAVNVPPSITAHPQSQSVNAGGVVNFGVATSGTGPFTYQWQRNAANLVGATNSTLSLNPVQTSDAGNYRVIVSTPFGSGTSSNAALTVNISTVRVVNTNATSASSFTLPIELQAVGTENAVGFTLSFDPSILTFTNISLDAGLSGAILISNTGQLGSGKLGVAVALSADNAFATGTQTLVHITFNVGVTTTALNTAVTFTDSPTARQISNAGAETLPSSFNGGTVAVAAVDFEGDVAPRPNGSRTLTITDWVQVGRFAAGLDTPAVGEFRRADCAPRSDLGNGTISVTDWVQAGRYATGVDPLTPVGGPSEPVSFVNKTQVAKVGGTSRTVMLETTNKVGQTYTVSTRLVAAGNENAIGFSLAFDPSLLTFTGATTGGNASGALLNVNTNNLAAGRVGVALSLSTGNIFPAGTQEVIKLTFVAATNATGTTSLNFSDAPVLREVSDAAANSLAATFTGGSLILSVPGPVLTINISEAGAVLSWPAAATGFVLESSSGFGTNWSSINANLITNAQNISTTLPITNQQFYRLRQ